MLTNSPKYVNFGSIVRIGMHKPEVIYLDEAAASIIDPAVARLVTETMLREFGNAGSRTHEHGLAASRAVGEARARVARAVGCDDDEVVFTSGATESDNLALLGLAACGEASGRRHVVSTAIEHKAVLEPLQMLAERGFEIELVPPDRDGRVRAEDVLAAVRADTLVVSVMHANNETGAIQPIDAIARGLAADGPYLHVDAAQTLGRATRTLHDRRIDLVSLSAHKAFGPKGVGALIARRRGQQRSPLKPLMAGGGQERGLRPGTLPVPLIAGFGLAAEMAAREEEARHAICLSTRSAAIAALGPLDPIIHGASGDVLPNILSVALPGLDSEAVMVALRGVVALSNGSACTSSSYQPSHVLAAMRLPEDEIAGTVRLSWSHATRRIPWNEIVRRLNDLRI